MFFKRLIRSQAGMSLVEMGLTMGLMGVAGMGLASLAGNMGAYAVRSEAIVAKTQFTSALNSYLNSSLGCNDLKVARIGGGGYTTDPAPISLTQWNYLGLPDIRGGVDPETGRKLTAFRYFVLETFDAFIPDLAGAPQVSAFVANGVPEQLYQSNVNVRVSITIGKKPYKHLFNVPVLVNSSGVIRFCSDEKAVAETCASLRGSYNLNSGQCDLDQACLIRGTYATLTCNNPPCDTRMGGARGNEFTGGASCPAESNPVLTHSTSWTSTRSCGKKCTATVANSMQWFSCMNCPSGAP
jgi:type II secretory pathway pseudopilin PulG